MFSVLEDEEKQKKSTADGSVGQSGASNLRRIYAANEVAEINRLLGKPLTDAKALGLIKNLLLDRVHTHLAKTMETNQIPDSGQSETAGNNGKKKNFYYLLINFESTRFRVKKIKSLISSGIQFIYTVYISYSFKFECYYGEPHKNSNRNMYLMQRKMNFVVLMYKIGP